MANPFYVEPANPLQALMIGGQSYDTANRRFLDQQTQQGRLEAAQALQSGGDVRPALSKLIGIGDVKGADAVANYAQQQAQQAYQQQALAETTRSHKANEATAAAALNQAKTIPFGGGLYRPNTGEIITTPSGGDAVLDDNTLTQMAQRARAGDTSVFSGLGFGNIGAINRANLNKRLATINSQAGETGDKQALRNAEYFGTKASQRAFGTREANVEMPAIEFQQLTPILREASAKVSRTDYPLLNTVLLAGEKHVGDPNVVAFGSALNTALNVYARAISPTGQVHEGDKKRAFDILQTAWSQGQFDAAFNIMQREISAARQSPGIAKKEFGQRFLGQPGNPGEATTQQPAQNSTPTIPPPPAGYRPIQ